MKSSALSILLALLLAALPAMAMDPFVVEDIRIDGNERISAGTVFTYLPIERGDRIDRTRAAEAVRALYRTGFFSDVSLERQGNILVIKVLERPSISKITLTGNKDLKTEDLMRGLGDIGLAEGETFDRLALDRVTQELTRQYNNRGKYNVSIRPQVRDLERNRVEITITISEGKASKIKHINIVGNTVFDDKELRRQFELDTTNWLSWYRRDDQYSREKLTGDLESLSAFYLDRGYVDFNVESTQVSISSDRREMYVVVNVREGEVYQFGDIRLTGDLVLPEEDLRMLLIPKTGETFSRRQTEITAESISIVLANIGYAFAEVLPIPEIDRDNRKVNMTFLVEPGKRVYVRRINFRGNHRTEDEVLRREMRQFEGAWYSQAAVDRSKVRLQRTGFFSKVDIETPRVPGSEDQIDVDITVEERQSGQFQIGIGYSQVSGTLLSFSISQSNFLGTGNRMSLTAQTNRFVKRIDAFYLDPYFTDDGVSLGYSLTYRELDQAQRNIAAFTSDVIEFKTLFGIPITETDTVNFFLGIDSNFIRAQRGFAPDVIVDYLDRVGRFTFKSWRAEASWARDTRNRFFNPTRGGLQRIALEATLPGSTVEYYRLNYQFARYFPLTRNLTFLTSVEIGYGDGYGNSDELPFFENFLAGGVRSVRGFEDNTLGPQAATTFQGEEFLQPIGGAFLTTGTAELIFPTPFGGASETTRFSVFLDVGNVYTDFNSWEASELRASTGLSFQWQAPVGPIIINLVKPIRKKDGDRTETIQFSFGDVF
ncbi:MAG TPA: outer membrane protein assembly factor BamA [Xanthomonadaceae bacterium]|nr:outer membrane protein assembly factor BamA [Xanthomonadaceae bacterium]